ncbi:MAG: ankyrin [Desulfocapsa sp.]|jgi:hypothetical protein|nr:ankyrin [Desulfocapsa sp.]MBU4237354.1 ankyrin [Pseudomonadota bacterium]MBU4584784.1 ankyrin [Pseudomonadota bacterium]
MVTQKNKVICPLCQGKKVVAGTCECNSEWRGTQRGEDWDECQCTPEQQCEMCKGTGYIDTDDKSS